MLQIFEHRIQGRHALSVKARLRSVSPRMRRRRAIGAEFVRRPPGRRSRHARGRWATRLPGSRTEAAKTALVEMMSAEASAKTTAAKTAAGETAAKSASRAAAMEMRFADSGQAHGEKRSKTKGC